MIILIPSWILVGFLIIQMRRSKKTWVVRVVGLTWFLVAYAHYRALYYSWYRAFPDAMEGFDWLALFIWFLITMGTMTGIAMLSGRRRLAMGFSTGFMIPIILILIYSGKGGDHFSLLCGIALLIVVFYPILGKIRPSSRLTP